MRELPLIIASAVRDYVMVDQGRTYGNQSCTRDPLSPGLAENRGLGWNSGAERREEKHISVIYYLN